MGCHADGGRNEADGAPAAAVRAGGVKALSGPLSYRSLLTGAIDYAGLFPPASLKMVDAVQEYGKHRQAPDNWALGRFVLPLARWDEFSSSVRDLASPNSPWPVSIVGAPADADRIRSLPVDATRSVVVAVECKVATRADAAKASALVRPGVEVFVEPMSVRDIEAIARELARAGASAKIRTGGVTADAFPSAREVLVFLRACRDANIRFKATAGLHHAVRGEYRLTYEPQPPTGLMFGFLNVAMAAAFLWFGRPGEVIIEVLQERSPDAFTFTDGGASWHDEQLTRAELEDVREKFFVGFGSCSFSEPMAEIGLEALPRA